MFFFYRFFKLIHLKKTFVIITLKQIMHHAKLTSMCEKLKKLRPYKSWSKGRSEEIESM